MVSGNRPLPRIWNSDCKIMEDLFDIQVIFICHEIYTYQLCSFVLYKNQRRHPRIAQRKAGIKDWHLMLIVSGLILVDVTILTLYTVLEGLVAKFTVGREPNRERPRAAIGVCLLLRLANNYYIRTN